jgi:hypothetical protein
MAAAFGTAAGLTVLTIAPFAASAAVAKAHTWYSFVVGALVAIGVFLA